jgi:uncharacterized DUF497 family protein
LVTVRFTWDPKKAASNFRKHGVSFEEAATAFGDPLGLHIEDANYADRTILIGQSSRTRVLFTVFTEVGDEDDTLVRIISARPATARERRRYEEGDY